MNDSEEFEDDNARVTNRSWSIDYLEQLDTSQYPFPNELWYIKSTTEVALKSTFMVFIGVIGIFLNVVILLIISRNKWLWTPSNYLVGNLAFVDLLTLLLCPWFMLVRDFYQNYVLGSFGCRFEGFLQGSLLLSSVGAVVLVSYDRLAAAALTSDARITKTAAPKLIICSWISALGLSLPWIFKREFVSRLWLDYVESFCVEDITFLSAYWHVILTILVWVPLGLMVITYGTIMWRLERSARKLRSHGAGRTITRARSKAMRITACVLLVTAICRIPYTVLVYWRNNLSIEINSVDGAYSILWFAANYLIYVNSALNPLIYGFTNGRFRRAMDRMPVLAFCKFGVWCCVCAMFQRKDEPEAEDKNTEKIFVIENSPQYNKKFGHLIKNMLHINKDSFDCSVQKADEITNKSNKPTKITPLKTDL